MAAISSTIAAVTAIAGAVSAGYSIYQGRKQEIEAKKEQKEQKKQQAAINAEKQRAESDRKILLSQQRYRMGIDRDYSTSGTSSVGRGLTTGQSTLG